MADMPNTRGYTEGGKRKRGEEGGTAQKESSVNHAKEVGFYPKSREEPLMALYCTYKR